MANIITFLKERRRRIFMSLVGVIICAISVGIFKLAALGVDPFQSLMSGLDSLIPIEFGTLYMTADLGVSTYDAVAIVMSSKWKLGKFKYIRIITDVVCVILGVGLYFLSGATIDGIGAVIGAGTIITAFFMGPLVDFFANKLAKPFLYGKASAEK